MTATVRLDDALDRLDDLGFDISHGPYPDHSEIALFRPGSRTVEHIATGASFTPAVLAALAWADANARPPTWEQLAIF